MTISVKKLLKFHIVSTAFSAVVEIVRVQPRKFFQNLKQHVWILLPLIVTQLLLKGQDIIDDRLMNTLGLSAFSVHNVQYSFYGLAQETGLVAATSLLIFWKRKETIGKQKTVLSIHLGLTMALSAIICFFTYKNIPEICQHFKISSDYTDTAQLYLKTGLINLFLRSVYVPVNTILIVCNHRLKSIACILSIILVKVILSWICVSLVWKGSPDIQAVTHAMLFYSIGTIVSLGLVIAYSATFLFKMADGWGKFNFKQALRVWPGELGIGAVSAFCPLLFSFQIAKANTSPGFFVTYQIALHLTCILALPILAGVQLAVRDASAEQSENKSFPFKPLHQSAWWPQFFYASLLPTVAALAMAALFPKTIIRWVYDYKVPEEHLAFLPSFFCAWILFQFGSVFLIMLRAAQRNNVATRNFIISGFFVQIGLTQLLLYFEICTSFSLGLVIVMSCLTFMILNWISVSELQFRYEQFNLNRMKSRLKNFRITGRSSKRESSDVTAYNEG